MLLLADSGSTKTHWVLIDNNVVLTEVFTSGINPFYQTQQEIEALISQDLLPHISNALIDKIFFYGAGCLPEKVHLLKNALSTYFESIIDVNSDLLATCRALAGNSPGIVGILGTGSNSCLYDGSQISCQVPSLGFILGDEGSGAALGKMLVSDFLKNQLPLELKNRFFEEYNLNQQIIMERIYRMAFPNRFLAGVSKFIYANMHEYPILKQLVERSFSAFFERNILQYGYADYPIHFSGSIAYYYKDILQDVADSFNYRIGKVEMYPMKGLIEYHTFSRGF